MQSTPSLVTHLWWAATAMVLGVIVLQLILGMVGRSRISGRGVVFALCTFWTVCGLILLVLLPTAAGPRLVWQWTMGGLFIVSVLDSVCLILDTRQVGAADAKATPQVGLYPHSSFPRLTFATMCSLYVLLVLVGTMIVFLRQHPRDSFDVFSNAVGLPLSAAARFAAIHFGVAALITLVIATTLEGLKRSRRIDYWSAIWIALGAGGALVASGAVAFWAYAEYARIGRDRVWQQLLPLAAASWCLTVSWGILTWPALVLTRPTADGAHADTVWEFIHNVRKRLRDLPVSLIKSRHWLTALFIDSNAPAMIALPISLVISFIPVLIWLRLLAGSELGLSGYAAFSAWFALTSPWVVAFARGLVFVEESCTRAYGTTLYRALQSLNRHMIILGYGHIGRRVVNEVVAHDLLGYRTLGDHLEGSCAILLPDRRLGKLLTRLVVIDDDETQSQGAVKTPEGAAISTVDIAIRDPDAPTLVPVVVGDASSEPLTLSRFDRASFIACLSPSRAGHDPALVVIERLKGLKESKRRVPPTVIATDSSDAAPHLTRTIVDYNLPVHYILPDHLEGLSAADVLHAAFTKMKTGPTAPVIVSGNGPRTFHLMDGFLKHLSFDAMTALTAAPDPSFVIVGTNASVSQRSHSALGDGDAPHNGSSKDPLTAWKSKHAEIGTRLNVDEERVARVITRQPREGFKGELWIPVVAESSADYQVWMTILKDIWPSVIVFAEPQPEEELQAVRAALMAINRMQAAHQLPLLVVSGETGTPYVMQAFENDLVYYSSLWKADREPWFPAPGMATEDGREYSGDFLVRVLDDPVDRVIGLIRAYRPFAADDKPLAIELEFCAPDTPGTIAGTLANLARLDVTEAKTPAWRPTLGNSKLTIRRHNRFQLRSFAYLSEQSANNSRFARMHIIAGQSDKSDSTIPSPRKLVSDLLRPDSAGKHDEYVNLIDRLVHQKPGADVRQTIHKLHELELVEQVKSCCGMPNCPVEAMHKIVSSSNRTVTGRMIENDVQRWKHARQIAEHFMVDQWKVVEAVPTSDLPLAVITYNGLDKAGSLAFAMNVLLLRTLKIEKDRQALRFRPTYISAYECHDESFAVFSCYGALEQATIDVGTTDTIEDITIQPVIMQPRTDPSPKGSTWAEYVEALVNHLNSIRSQEGSVRPQFRHIKTDTLAGTRLTITRDATA